MTGTLALDYIMAACYTGTAPPALALARLLAESRDLDVVNHFVTHKVAPAADNPHLRSGVRHRLNEVVRLLRTNQRGCSDVVELLRSEPPHLSPDSLTSDSDSLARATEARLDATRRFFDDAVLLNECASVALYSLGDSYLLAAATTEVVSILEGWGVIASDRAILHIGCGIGRLEQRLASRVRAAYGLDVAPNMLAAAARRCASLPNVHLFLGNGLDLAPVAPSSMDLVYAVDTFPYITQAGRSVTEMHFRETHRVLRPRGDFAILGFSYGGDARDDRQEIGRFAATAGFEIVANGSAPLTMWDGMAFHLRRRD